MHSFQRMIKQRRQSQYNNSGPSIVLSSKMLTVTWMVVKLRKGASTNQKTKVRNPVRYGFPPSRIQRQFSIALELLLSMFEAAR